MIKKVFIIILVVLFISQPFLSYSLEALSLEPLIKEAKENNPEIKAVLKRYDAAKARIPQAKSLDDPVLGFNSQYTPKNPFNLSETPAMERMLSVTQMFPFFGKLPLKGKIALVESQMIAAEYKDKGIEITNKVEKAYYDLFMNYKEIELLQESTEFLKSIAQIAEAKYVVGDLSQEEIFKIDLEIANLSNRILNLQQEQSAKKTYLNSLLNRQPESGLGRPQLDEQSNINLDINTLYRFTLENQPELLIFSYAIEKNKYAKSLAKKSFFPDFMAGIVMRGFTTGSIGPWDLMMAFTVPIWFWSKQRYQVKEAIANLEEAEFAYAAMKNKALAETKDLYTKVEIAKNNVRLYKNNLIPLLKNSIDSSLAALRAGKADLMMLLDTERMLVDTEINYYKMLIEYNMNLADLERVVGLDLSEVKNER